jgi:dephospho-CoA kinase
MPTVGITGGVATGKSTVAALFRDLGAVVLSADEIAREVLAPGTPALEEVVHRFGSEMLHPDGTLNRARLGTLIFANPEARHALEAITHPRILALMKERLQAATEKHGPKAIIVAEVPLLYEVGMESWFDAVLVVAASEPTQIARLRARDSLSEAEARQRIASQRPLSEKIARADYVIWNEGDPKQLAEAVKAVWRKLSAAVS